MLIACSGGGKNARTAGQPRNIRVESQIVKKVGGKHRYFFAIRNEDSKPFEGAVEIALQNNQPNHENGRETFNTTSPMQPGGSTSVNMDINTGPMSVHGDWGIKSFRYEVVSGGQVVASGTGNISDKYEDLSR